MRIVLAAFLLAFLVAYGAVAETADPGSDAPEGPRHVAAFKDAASYPQALQVWRTPEDVNAWIGAKFHYDMSRAMVLSESQRSRSGQVSIYRAEEFFATPSGICVDLSRFAVETLRQIDPELKANYLMIEFSPVAIGGNTLRMHWLVSFTRDGKYYFFADSKRPGHISGPHASVQEFVAGYAEYRNRQVVAFRELDSYQRKQRAMASTRRAPEPERYP
ncbi:MAG TPA: transglutaminase-like domain-containing protein [Ramlibacter sp.]|jgi:hypothetical protein